jgi:hypothetical protein
VFVLTLALPAPRLLRHGSSSPFHGSLHFLYPARPASTPERSVGVSGEKRLAGVVLGYLGAQTHEDHTEEEADATVRRTRHDAGPNGSPAGRSPGSSIRPRPGM